MDTGRGRRARPAVIVLVTGGLLAGIVAMPQAASATTTNGWTVTLVESTVTVSSTPTSTVGVDCPAGAVPLSGGVYRTDGSPTQLRLASELVRTTDAVSSPNDYRATIQMGGETSIEVTAQVVCAKTDQPLTITAVQGQLSITNTGSSLATASTTSCPDGSFALNGSLDPTATADHVSGAWFIHSSPSYDGVSWHALAASPVNQGFVVDVPIVVHCLAATDVPGATVAHTIASLATTNSFLDQPCPAGTSALAGGGYGSQSSPAPDLTPDTPQMSQWHTAGSLSTRTVAAHLVNPTNAGVITEALCWHVPKPSIVQLQSKPPALTTSTAATFAFTWTEVSPTTVYCQLDAAAEQPCTSPVSYQGLSDGSHTWHWRSVNTDGDEATGSYTWTVDTTRPTASMTRPNTPFTLTGSTAVGWTGADATAGIKSFDILTRVASFNSDFIAVPSGQPYSAAQTGTTLSGLTPGTTYCFSVQATDKAGWTSKRSAERCVSTPVDDRKLSASAHWSRKTGSGLYAGTETVSTVKGAALTLAGARVARIAIVATTCPTCGKVAVYAGKTLVGNLSLKSTTLRKKRLLLLPRISLRTATISIRVLTSGRPVRIDAVGISRS